MNHRLHARTLRRLSVIARNEGRIADSNELAVIAATLSHHRLILVPDVTRTAGYLLVHVNADDDWQSLTMHATKADAVKQRAVMRRHWRKLRGEGVEV